MNVRNDYISRNDLIKAARTWDTFGYTETGAFVQSPKNDSIRYVKLDDVLATIVGMSSAKCIETSEVKSFLAKMHEQVDGMQQLMPLLREKVTCDADNN